MQQVCSNEVLQMYVVADSGSVSVRVVRAEDRELVTLSDRDLQREWDEMRFDWMSLAVVSGRVGDVEVAQAGRCEIVALCEC